MPKDTEQFIRELEIPEGGSIAWSAPVISGNKLVFGACDKHLYCLDKNTGKLLWKFLTGGPIISIPNIVDDKIFFPSCDKYLYCLSLKDGSLIWKKLFPEFFWSSPTFANGILYAGCKDNNLYALSADDGSTIWNFRTGGLINAAPAIINDSIYFGSFDNNFYCLDIEGRLKWKFLAGNHIGSGLAVSENGGQAWSVLDKNVNRNVDNGMLYFGSYDNYHYALSLDGEFKWKFLTGNITVTPATIYNGNIYFGSWDRNLYSLNAKSGRMNWRFVTGGFIGTPPFISDNTAYFGSYDQNLYALNLDGTKAWAFTTGGYIMCPPIVADGILYFGSWDTYLYAIRLKDRKILWKFQTGMPAASIEPLLKEFTELVQTERKPFTFSDWKPETLKKSYSWEIEVGKLVTSTYKSENPYMNKPVYRMESPYTEQKKKMPWER